MGFSCMEDAMDKEPFCPMGCWSWCGRPCKWDPEKSNALIFNKDGSEKTLTERGLGWSSPPLPVFTSLDARKRKSVTKLKALVSSHLSNKESNKQSNMSNEAFDKKAYQREYMRQMRAKKKGSPK
jgi:hypothetical protein